MIICMRLYQYLPIILFVLTFQKRILASEPKTLMEHFVLRRNSLEYVEKYHSQPPDCDPNLDAISHAIGEVWQTVAWGGTWQEAIPYAKVALKMVKQYLDNDYCPDDQLPEPVRNMTLESIFSYAEARIRRDGGDDVEPHPDMSDVEEMVSLHSIQLTDPVFLRSITESKLQDDVVFSIDLSESQKNPGAMVVVGKAIDEQKREHAIYQDGVGNLRVYALGSDQQTRENNLFMDGSSVIAYEIPNTALIDNDTSIPLGGDSGLSTTLKLGALGLTTIILYEGISAVTSPASLFLYLHQENEMTPEHSRQMDLSIDLDS
jgi:hypothetical protein